MKRTRNRILAAVLFLALTALCSCYLTACTTAARTDFKKRLVHDGKTVIAVVKPVAQQLAEDELKALIEEAVK